MEVVLLNNEPSHTKAAPLTSYHSPLPTAIIRVRDFGPGVPDEALPHLFRPFYRVEGARDRQSGGVGLGLAIAERAVRAHGGAVVARNAQNGGLIVEIRMPVRAIAITAARFE